MFVEDRVISFHKNKIHKQLICMNIFIQLCEKNKLMYFVDALQMHKYMYITLCIYCMPFKYAWSKYNANLRCI